MKECPRGSFRCNDCGECVPHSTPYSKHLEQCVSTQAKNNRKPPMRGRHAR